MLQTLTQEQRDLITYFNGTMPLLQKQLLEIAYNNYTISKHYVCSQVCSKGNNNK